jgi:uncharacterized protein (DUF1697 family)
MLEHAMVHRQVALIRGLSVGRARRLAMGDLRTLIEDLGYSDVHTLLASGNVVFTARRVPPGKTAVRISDALTRRLGVPTRVTVLTAAEIDTVVEQNALSAIASNSSRLLLAFLENANERLRLEPLLDVDWAPEALAIGTRVAYMWCPEGVLASRLLEAIGRAVGTAVTIRNWATVTKLHAALVLK